MCPQIPGHEVLFADGTIQMTQTPVWTSPWCFHAAPSLCGWKGVPAASCPQNRTGGLWIRATQGGGAPGRQPVGRILNICLWRIVFGVGFFKIYKFLLINNCVKLFKNYHKKFKTNQGEHWNPLVPILKELEMCSSRASWWGNTGTCLFLSVAFQTS